MDESRLPASTRPIADVRATRLEIRAGAARGNLEPGADTGRKYLEVVRHRARESGVATREKHDTVRKPEALEHRFGMRGEQLELIPSLLRLAVAHELHLVELVKAEQASRILAVGPRLAPEAWRVCDERAGKRCNVDDLVTVQVGDGNLGRRNQEHVIARKAVHVILELRQLAGSRHRRAIDDVRNPCLVVAVLP